MDKREQIIQIATQLFSERGFENTPISMICEKAGVSKGLVSHHFKSKNGLLREIFMITSQKIVEINRTDKVKPSANERLLDLLESFFAQLQTDKLFFQFSLNIMLQPQTRIILKDLIEERSSFIMNAVQGIFNEIDTPNSVVLTYMFIAELDGIALNYLGVFGDYPLSLIKEHLIEKYTEK